jgi:hypothetical protein
VAEDRLRAEVLIVLLSTRYTFYNRFTFLLSTRTRCTFEFTCLARELAAALLGAATAKKDNRSHMVVTSVLIASIRED